MAITINWGTRVINVPKADTTLVSAGPPEVRELDIDDFRKRLNDLQDDEEGIPFPTTHIHTPPLTVGGTTLARSVEIINGYTITFEDGNYQVDLINANSNLSDVTNLNSVGLRSANSAGLIELSQQDIENIKYLIETLRPHHTGMGNVYYWDPVSGSDSASGRSATQAVQTFTAAHDLCVSGKHDIIVALSTDTGQTVVDDTIEITKNYVLLRGPGRDFKIKPTSTSAPTIKINAVGVEVSGMIVNTAATGGQSAIEVAAGADFFFLNELWTHNAEDDAVEVNGPTAYGRINEFFIEYAASHGIHLKDNVRHTKILEIECDGCVNGVFIEGPLASNNLILGGRIYGSSGYGVRIESNAKRTLVGGVDMYDNVGGSCFDDGILTECVGITQMQMIRDAMELSSTSGQDAIDEKLNRTYNATVAGL